jgi:hypothetical protein
MAGANITNFGTDGLLATTLKNYTPKLEDNVFGAKVLLWILKSAGVVRDVAGGSSIVKPLIYAANSNVGSYEDDDVFATAANAGITAAEFPWKQYYGLVHFTGIELAKNSGQQQLLDLMRSRMQQVELSIADGINQMLWADGAGNGGKDFMGLGGIISAADPSVGDLGGIDVSTSAYWAAKVKAASASNTLTLADMSSIYNTTSEGNDHPDYCVTTQTGFEAFEALLTSLVRYEDTKMGEQGFQNLKFKGVPIAFDDDVEGGDAGATTIYQESPMFFLNTKYLELSKLAGKWFSPSELLQPTNQDAFYKHLVCYGNLTVSNRSRQGVLYDIHA